MGEHWILEVKEKLDGTVQTFRCRLLRGDPAQAVVYFEHDHTRRVSDVILPAGAVTFGHFWVDRPYNAYHWLAPSGGTLGVYFNVSDRTSLERERIRWRDLVVDVLVTPDGRCRVMDEEELPADADPALLARIHRTRDCLVAHGTRLVDEIEARSAAARAETGW